MTLTRKRIDVTITLGSGDFGEGEGSTKVFHGHRVSCQMTANAGESMSSCACRIYGASLDDMNRLTSMGPINQTAFGKNTIQIEAGDDGDKLAAVFFGALLYSQGNLQKSPDAYLDLYATCEGLAAIKPVNADTWKGETPVWLMMSKFAADAGWALEDLGVKAVINDPYYSGSTLEKIRACAREASIAYRVSNKVLTIFAADSEVPQGNIVDISPSTGLVNYPLFAADSINFRSVFNPQFLIGGKVILTGSEVSQANGPWNIAGVSHSIESEIPDGEWFSDVKGVMKNVWL